MAINKILIIDSGVSFATKVLSTVRKMGVYAEIVGTSQCMEYVKEESSIALVFLASNESYDGSSFQYSSLISLNIPLLIIKHEKYLMAKSASDFDWDNIDDPSHYHRVFKSFLFEKCKAEKNWYCSSFVSNAIKEIQDEVGEGKVLLALSGGLDSTVLSTLLSRAIGERLTCVFLDTGLMRKGESEEIKERFSDGSCKFIHIDAKKRFLEALKGIIDPEEKRRAIGECFIKVFEERACEIGNVDFLAQGTIYADVLESGKSKNGKLVKTHHNVGGLPSIINFKSIIEPFKILLKEEVRKIGEYLGLPSSIIYRQPFPGPGLAIRILGEVTEDRLGVLRDADAIWRCEVEKYVSSNTAELMPSSNIQSIDQYFAVLTNIKTVGVRNGERTYGYTLALRAVATKDFVSACPIHFTPEFYNAVSTKILREVPIITRIVYDITSKPPSTIEWE